MANYFELFALDPSSDLDLVKLQQQYEKLQLLTHPDRHVNTSAQQKRLLMQKNAEVNDGYVTLKDPVRRCQHLLQLVGVDVSNEQTTLSDHEFLCKLMEWRDALEQSDADEMERVISELSQAQEHEFGQFQAHYEQHEFSVATGCLRKLIFITKLQGDAQTRIRPS